MKLKTLLIDADILLHRFGNSNQSKIEWGEGETSLALTPIEDVLNEVDAFIAHLGVVLPRTEPFLCFSGDKNFRYKVLPTYKHNRAKLEKPVHFQAIKEHLMNNYTYLMQPILEGDDLMGIISTTERGQHIICSNDKDMRQIPGKHYNWNTGKKFTVTKAQADDWFYMQVLTGDTGDGYTGIPGVGPVNAAKILGDTIYYADNQDDLPYTPWEKIVLAYEAAGLTEENALQQARVARILRKGEYDFDTKEVTLWTPTEY
jgi:DNA polymerase-1